MESTNSSSKKKVDIVGSDWSGLGAAYHLCNQSAQYSKEGLEVEFPVLQDRPELPAPLGILFYTQGDFDVVWCRGPVKERIFNPWMELMSMKGCRFVDRKKVTDLSFDDKTGCISYVFVTMRHTRQMKLFWLSELPQSKNSLRKVLSTREEFLKVLNLDASDLVSTKLWLGKKIRIPFARNVCSSFDDSSGCNLNDLFDEHRNSPATILQADFYHANELLPLKDEHIAPKVMSYLSKCVKDLEAARVTNVEITRFPKSLTHFFPAGNRVVDFLGEGNYAKIIPQEEDEPHTQALRNLNRNFKELMSQFRLSDYLLQ
ncbi:hypothetical protein OIU77_020839 [Salix suchowensis]|uniref:Uncharacterized protein n=1 Tax=Salix suchowensis TaxID=1278906 RepID=A0ABQ9C7U3_9ROSI|nr:hypothetical protein OIU77_020839 [Salix suchowensis]